MKGLGKTVDRILSTPFIQGVVGKGVVREINCVRPPNGLTPIITIRFCQSATRQETAKAYAEILSTAEKHGRVFLVCADVPVQVSFEELSTGYSVHCYYGAPFDENPVFPTDSGIAYMRSILSEYIRDNEKEGIPLFYEVVPHQKIA